MKVSKFLVLLMIALYAAGFYNLIAYAVYVGSKTVVLAEEMGYSKVQVIFNLSSEVGSIIIHYRVRVKPTTHVFNWRVKLTFTIVDSKHRVAWRQNVDRHSSSPTSKNVSGILALEVESLAGAQPIKVVGLVENVAWAELESLEVQVRYSPLRAGAYSTVILIIGVPTACIAPPLITLAVYKFLERIGLKRTSEISILNSVTAIIVFTLAYLVLWFSMYSFFGGILSFEDYLNILLQLIQSI